MGSRENRRHPRLATRQEATIRWMGLTLHGEIRNYCQAGLYLALPDPLDPSSLTLLPETRVEVEFSTPQQVGRRDFRIEARVAHSLPNGLGLHVASMPQEALQALQAAARAEAADTGTSRIDPEMRQSLQQECTAQFSTFLNEVFKDFFLQVPDRLAEAGDQVSGYLEQNRYRFVAQELLRKRVEIKEHFFAAIREHLQRSPRRPEDAAAGEVSPQELALVEDEQFEDWLNLSAVINQVESDLNPLLVDFQRRYGLLTATDLDSKNNPFGPEVICRTFQDAIRALDHSNPMRATIYKTFGTGLAQRYPPLLEQLNHVLAALDALLPKPRPRVRPATTPTQAVAENAAAPTSTGHRDRTHQELAEITEALLRHYRQSQPVPAQEPSDYGLERLLAALGKGRGAAQPGSLFGAGTQPAARTMSRTSLLELANGLLQGHANTASARPGGLPQRPTDRMTEADLSDLLRAIDALPSADWVGRGGPTGPSLSEQLARAGRGLLIPQPYRVNLDAAAGLVGRAVAESVSGSEVESLLKRLERPLLKLALRDPGFLNDPDHPARQVVDLLDQYAMAADDRGRFFDTRLQRFLYLLVERICSQADSDPGVFDLVRENLGKLLLPIRQTRRLRVARLQEACEGRDRIRQARARVNDTLADCLGGREVPEVVLRLLDAGWRHYMVLLEMRFGTGATAWQEALSVLERLQAWMQPGYTPGPGFQQEAAALSSQIERKLAGVNVDAGQLATFMDVLTLALQSVGQDAGAHPTVRYPFPVRDAVAATADREAADRENGWARRLRLGDWWLFRQEDRWLPMQLIWLSQPVTHCAFANRSATNKIELSLAEFDQQLENGQIKTWADQDRPLLERSEFNLLDEGRQLLLQQAVRDAVSGLPNRKGFLQAVAQAVRQSKPGAIHVVSILEFDQFRMIYNTCGVEATEGLARDLAQAARASIGPEGILASFRDDTLALFMPDCSPDAGCDTASKLMDKLRDYRFRHGEHSYTLGLNIGLARYITALISPEEAIRRADAACAAAKAQGRNRMQVYEQANVQLQTQESLIDWAGRIDSLLEGSGLYLRCQMVMPIGTDPALLPYYEILLGIEPEPGVNVSPMSFIPVVERLKRSHEVDLWVMQRVFEWIAQNRTAFAGIGGFSVNLSALSLSSPDVIAYLQDRLGRPEVPAEKLTFEITETAAIESYGAAQEFIRQMRRYGCRFSLDDFGSGYTSYAHLKNLRTDSLKIDGAFVKDMLSSPGDYAMVKSMRDIGHSLGMHTVAEYVESPMILGKLREIGVDYAQGYAIHKPCRIEDIGLS